MKAGEFQIDDVYAGCGWSNEFEFFEDDGTTPLDLTGYTFDAEFVVGSTVVDLASGSGLTVTASPASVRASLTSAQIATLGGAGALADFSLYWVVGGVRSKVLHALAAIGQGPRT